MLHRFDKTQLGSSYECYANETSGERDFFSPPVYLVYDSDSISPETYCVFMQFFLVSISPFQNEYIPEVPLSFSTQQVFRSYDVVYNKHGLVVGQLLGDGVLVNATDDKVPDRFTFCLVVDTHLPHDSSKYSRYDFGRVVNGQIRPWNLPNVERFSSIFVGYSQDLLCATFEDGSFNPHGSYLPIARYPRSESVDKTSYFPQYEIALLYVLAVVYGIMCAFGLFLFVAKILAPLAGPLSVIVLVLFLLICSLRSIYFFLLVNGIFDEGKNSDLQFVLVVLPIIFVFYLFSLQVLVWLASLKRDLRITARNGVFIFCVFLGIVFIVWAILFATLTPSVTDPCPGRIDPTIDTSSRDAANLAFTIFLVVLSSIMFVIFMMLGFKIVKTAGSNSSDALVFFATVLWKIGINALALITLSVFLLILAVANPYSVYFVFFMLISAEVLPLLLVLYLLNPIQTLKDAASHSSDSRGTLGSHGSRGTSGTGTGTTGNTIL